MSRYFSTFQSVGEIADMLLLREPKIKLLVDISLDPPGHEETAYRKYPNRTSFAIIDRELIDKFLAKAAVGKMVKVSGTFSQSAYIPHKTSYIDTLFCIDDFSFVKFKPHPSRTTDNDGTGDFPRQLH